MKKFRLGSLTATLAATLSAVCCVLPIALLTVGFASLGPFAVLVRYRTITQPISFLLLASAFYVVYRPGAEADCAAGACSPKSLRRSRRIVWIAAALMVVIVILGSLPARLAI